MKNTVSIIYSQRLIAEALKSIIENETEFRVVKMLNFKLREEIEVQHRLGFLTSFTFRNSAFDVGLTMVQKTYGSNKQ